jgi:hypothetical protein
MEELFLVRMNLLPVDIKIEEWSDTRRSWILNSEGNYRFLLKGLKPDRKYKLTLNGEKKQAYRANEKGEVSFVSACHGPSLFYLAE